MKALNTLEASGGTKMVTLSDLVGRVDAVQTKITGFLSNNLGNPTFLANITMEEFCRISSVANEEDNSVNPDQITQRRLDPVHAQKLAVYMLKGLVSTVIAQRKAQDEDIPSEWTDVQKNLGEQPYQAIQPLVANIRECKPNGDGLNVRSLVTSDDEHLAIRISLRQNQRLWVIDGQHRRRAMEKVIEFLNHALEQHKHANNSLYGAAQPIDDQEHKLWVECLGQARGVCKVSVEIHIGLGVEQERQLFHDLNRLGKKVETGMALQFDQSNPLTVFTQQMLQEFNANPEQPSKLRAAKSDRDAANWEKDDGALALKDIVAVNATLFLGNTNIKAANEMNVTDEKRKMAKRFWEAVVTIPGFGETDAKKRTTIAQPVMLKGLAKVLFDIAFSNRTKVPNREDLIQKFFDHLLLVNFDHDNPAWNYFNLTTTDRAKYSLIKLGKWLGERKAGTNLDLGALSATGAMRFSPRHNDIFPVLSDMIRWRMDLPSRHDKV